MRRGLSILGMALMGSWALAESESISLVEAFAHCDSTFVSTLYQQSLTHDALLSSDKEKIATFAVPDRTNADESVTRFEMPVQDHTFQIIGYYDSVVDLSETEMGQYYFWGIYLDGSLDEVKASLANFDWKTTGNLYYTESYRYNSDERQWEPNPEAEYAVPPEQGIERMLVLSEDRGQTILSCTLQGEITDRFLIKERPELYIFR